ncbi:type II pantothenate kinase [Cytobacillus sp. NCCP-133]|uniref:type II pantothenate kinase n=1 Tax=Cytobacillus sp. NCCP-133 TaxID=766848 RepID=UPI0022300361|nr:type II pantothenate kinase [Cytobacillus sp. NCCP-133]GLB60871.1 type II pantothenate kinase [Cytobacillus sp. NCCP-133]
MKPVKIGIDAGGTLLKMVYGEKGRFHYKTFSTHELQALTGWLNITIPVASIALTGGRSASLKKDYFPDASIISEFEANCEGAAFLMKGAGIWKDPYLLINIGTGTSIYMNKGTSYSRLLGSGIGGGTFMGLGKLLTGVNDFAELVSLAAKGDNKETDLLVKDIYFPSKPPIGGSLTASNFGKSKLNENVSNEDKMSSLTNMIAETIVLLSMQAAALHQVHDLVYIGGTLKSNNLLKSRLEHYTRMLNLSPNFLPNGEYSGAVGAFMSL